MIIYYEIRSAIISPVCIIIRNRIPIIAVGKSDFSPSTNHTSLVAINAIALLGWPNSHLHPS